MRIVSADSNLAAEGRSVLENTTSNDDVQATVILGEDSDLNGVTVVNPDRRTILASTADRSSISEAVRKILDNWVIHIKGLYIQLIIINWLNFY